MDPSEDPINVKLPSSSTMPSTHKAHIPLKILLSQTKHAEIFPEEVPLGVLDSKSFMSMDHNGKYTKHNRHIARRIQFVRNGEKF